MKEGGRKRERESAEDELTRRVAAGGKSGTRKGCGKVRKGREGGPDARIAGLEEARGRWVSMGHIEEPFSYSKQQRPAGAATPFLRLLLQLCAAYPLPRQSFTLAGGHRSSQWPSYPSTPATCPGNDHRPGPALVFSIAFRVSAS